MSHKNFDSLKQAIMKKAKEGMDKAVLPVVKDQMQDSIKKVVYDVYKPMQYHDRRMFGGGGLGDKSQMKGNVATERKTGFDYSVTNEAKAVTKNIELAPLIIKGQSWALLNGYGLYHDRIASYDTMMMYNSGSFVPYYEPRDFIAHTKQNLSKSQLAKKLEVFMK